ncbi:hypothetical protein WA026_000076 [Henosepilachna vigintioctopunctata]|uniref:Cytidyltransferase-like domain-containing protein n=1 Tax=Henosepilachna vigintioctopunctata TaxID=420089 RepID=A0AAW1V6E4_9CUCU
MSGKTGLLLLTNSKQIGLVLSSIQQKVTKTLYIQLLNALTDNLGGINTNFLTSIPKYSQEIHGIYTQAARHCKNLDVRVLLSGIKYNINKIKTQNPIDIVIFDRIYNRTDIDHFLKGNISTLTNDYKVLTLDDAKECQNENNEETGCTQSQSKIYKHGVLGGTFDRLHVAHKLLLSEMALRTEIKTTVGVTDETMIKSKVLHELIENLDTRIDNVRNFLSDICPELPCDVVAISDQFGPSVVDPTMDMLVVSQETIRGGNKINEVRESKNLPKLHIHPVELMDEPDRDPAEEKKISSSTLRMRLLGTLLKPIQNNTNIPQRPYVIGLTGGIASGKSGLSHWMQELGAHIIDADSIAHGIYKRGKPCYNLLIEKFGESIIGADREIDRAKLGAIVFKDRNQLEKLNNTVWPEMLKDILEIVKNAKEDVVVIDAAILLQAEWHNYCHEVWTTLVPKQEAVRRLVERNHLNEEQALLRINSQPSNESYLAAANVVFCTLWHKEYTRQQVQRAWQLLRERMCDDKLENCRN